MNKKKIVFIILLAIIILTTLSFVMMQKTNSLENFIWYPKHYVMLIFPLLFLAMTLIIKYCKKTLKIVLSLIIILITLSCIMLYIDIDRVSTCRKPIFAWETNNTSGFPGVTPNVVTYQGLGYRVIYETEYFEDGSIASESTTMYMLGKQIAGFRIEELKVTIAE